jgi:ABC-type Mn2+/Zn2+ transport system ATPase subunit
LIARALATKPEFLLLDEPTAGIDTSATQSLLELLRRLHSGQQLSILMVSHDLSAIRRYAQEVIWLHQGKVLHGAVSDLLRREQVEALLDLELN